MELQNKLKKAALGTALDYIAKDPERNIHKLMSWVDKAAGEGPNALTSQRAAVRKVLDEPESSMYKFIMGIFRDIDTEVLKTVFTNFIVNANIIGTPRQAELRELFGCNMPWAILMDPTTACNLRCTGCWAADYGKSLSMSYAELDDIIRQGKDLGIYMYLFSGGEPLTRKADIIKLCEEHSDCQFLAFTNGTLIDADFAREMLRVKNFIPAISIEGFEAATDARRGKGTYQAVMAAMSRLKAYRLPFGVSCCYTSQNIDSLSSEEFIDHVIGCGAKFAWFFHYMPVGVDAVTELLPSPQQREHMYHTLREYRRTKELFFIDFQNDGEYVGGCVAGGRSYLHISAGGGQGEDALRGLHVVERVRELRREEEHYQCADNAQDEESQPGDGEDPLHLVRAVHSVCLAYHAGEGHGQARRCDGQEHAVYVVGHEEVRIALVAEYIPQRHLVDEAEDLHNHDAGSEDGRAVQVVLLFGF